MVPVTEQAMRQVTMAGGRTGILVLGMHRSGTSVLTGMLGLLGCALPASLMPAGVGNPTGHWESAAICAFNDQALALLGSDWRDWTALAPDWLAGPVGAGLVARGRALLVQEFGGADLFALKDPRNCRLAALWAAILRAEGVTPVVALPLRHPLEVAASLAARDGMAPAYGVLLWLRHVLDAEVDSRGCPRAFVDYAGLLDGWGTACARLGQALGLAWPRLNALVAGQIDGFVDGHLRHHARPVAADNPALSAWVRIVWQVLSRWAEQGEDQADWPVLDAVRAGLDAAGPAFAPLLRDGADDRMARAELVADLVDARAQLATAEQVREQGEADVAHWREAAQAASARAEAALAACAAAEATAQAALDTVDRQASHLRQRQAEIDAAWASLTEARADSEHWQTQATAQADRATAITARLVEADAWVLRLAGERAAHALHLRKTDRALALVRAEVAQYQRAEQAYAARHAELARAIAAQAEALTARHRAQHQVQADDHASAMAQARADLAIETARADHAEAAQAEAEQQVNERFGELTQMTRLLREQGEAVDRATSDAAWLRSAHDAIQGQPRWWGWLPPTWQRHRLSERLRRRGLFDADAYAARYPDVAASGIAPLHHFIRHGLVEGRQAHA